MRAPALAFALALGLMAVPSFAGARPFTAGVGLGLTQAKADAATGAGSNHTLSLFGRLGLGPRLSGQLEVLRIQTDSTSVDLRTATALLVFDLGTRGPLIPVLLGGVGLDDASTAYGSDTTAKHVEAGLGVEYRADGGLTIGADVRIGDRSLDVSQQVYPVTGGGVALYTPSTLQDGEYRSARVTLGVRF
jgi:hypothetical protein